MKHKKRNNIWRRAFKGDSRGMCLYNERLSWAGSVINTSKVPNDDKMCLWLDFSWGTLTLFSPLCNHEKNKGCIFSSRGELFVSGTVTDFGLGLSLCFSLCRSSLSTGKVVQSDSGGIYGQNPETHTQSETLLFKLCAR